MKFAEFYRKNVSVLLRQARFDDDSEEFL